MEDVTIEDLEEGLLPVEDEEDVAALMYVLYGMQSSIEPRMDVLTSNRTPLLMQYARAMIL